VVDFSCPEFESQLNTTIEVLNELGASEKEMITVYNKIDQGEQVMSKLRARTLTPKCTFISCKTGDGIDELMSLVRKELNQKVEINDYHIPHEKYELVAKLREQGCIISALTCENGSEIKASPRGKLKSILKNYVV